MKRIKLNINLPPDEAGCVVEMRDRIANHFIAKGWGEEAEAEPTKKATATVKKERHVVTKKIK